MKTLRKSKVKNENKIIQILNLNELLKIRGGEENPGGAPAIKEIDID